MADISFDEMVGIDWDHLVTFDQSKVKVPTGRVLCRVTSAEIDHTASVPTWKLVVVAKGYRFYPVIAFDPEDKNTVTGFFRRMRCLGLDGDYFSMRPLPSKVAKNVLGRTFSAEVGHRSVDGIQYPVLVEWRPVHVVD